MQLSFSRCRKEEGEELEERKERDRDVLMYSGSMIMVNARHAQTVKSDNGGRRKVNDSCRSQSQQSKRQARQAAAKEI